MLSVIEPVLAQATGGFQPYAINWVALAPEVVLTVALVAVILPCAVAAWIVAQQGYRVDAPWWIIFNGAIVMPISFYCLATGPRYISGPEVAMFYLLETVLAPIWVWLIFAEVPTTQSLIGGLILIVALVAHSLWQLHQGRKRRAALAVRHPA